MFHAIRPTPVNRHHQRGLSVVVRHVDHLRCAAWVGQVERQHRRSQATEESFFYAIAMGVQWSFAPVIFNLKSCVWAAEQDAHHSAVVSCHCSVQSSPPPGAAIRAVYVFSSVQLLRLFRWSSTSDHTNIRQASRNEKRGFLNKYYT